MEGYLKYSEFFALIVMGARVVFWWVRRRMP
jgi:hypothetical protein